MCVRTDGEVVLTRYPSPLYDMQSADNQVRIMVNSHSVYSADNLLRPGMVDYILYWSGGSWLLPHTIQCSYRGLQLLVPGHNVVHLPDLPSVL